MTRLIVEIVSPTGRIFRGEASGVRAPGVEGSFEVLRDHAPMIAAFEIGPLRVTDPSGDQFVFATSGGFLEVLNNTVTILAESAELGTDIDIERAREAEKRALKALEEKGDSLDRESALTALERARNRVRISMGTVGRELKV